MAITVDDIQATYSPFNPTYASEAQSSVEPQESMEAQWDKKWGLAPKSAVAFPTELATNVPKPPQQGGQLPVASRKITIKEDMGNAPILPADRMVLPELPQVAKPKGLLAPTGDMPGDLLKGVVAGVGGAAAGEVDTLDWAINKIADIIPGVPRQEVLGRLKNALTPADLDKDDETLTYTIGNALGYGAAQMALLYTMIFKPLKAAKVLNAAKLRDVGRIATKAGRTQIKADAALAKAMPGQAAYGQAWLDAINAGKFGKRPALATRALDKLGNVGLAGPVGLGLHGGITGAKTREQMAAQSSVQGPPDPTTGVPPQAGTLPAMETLKENVRGFIEGGTQGFMMGTTLGLMHNWGQMSRAAGMGTIFGGMSIAEGADVKRGFADFITGALMGYMPNKPGERWMPFSGENKTAKIPSPNAAKADVDPRVAEDIVAVAQAANINPQLVKSWAEAEGLSPKEAAERVKQMAEFYGGFDPKTTHPYLDANLGMVFKKNGIESPETAVFKEWKKIKKQFKNPHDAALQLDVWAKDWITKQGIDVNPELMAGIENMVWFVTKDAKGYSPVGNQYTLPAGAFSGTHTTSWAGSIWREIFKTIRNRGSETWRATLADGREVDLADSPGSRLSKNGKNVVTNDGIEIPVGQVKAITDITNNKPLLMQPQKTAKDIRQERAVAKKAADKLKRDNIRRIKEGLPPLDEYGAVKQKKQKAPTQEQLGKEASERWGEFQQLPEDAKRAVFRNLEAANMNDFANWAFELAAQEEANLTPQQKPAAKKTKTGTTTTTTPEPQALTGWPVIGQIATQFEEGRISQSEAADQLVKVLPPEQLEAAFARFAGVPMGVIKEQQRQAEIDKKRATPQVGRGTAADELMGKAKKVAGKSVKMDYAEEVVSREEFAEAINKRTTQEQRDKATEWLGSDVNDFLFALHRRVHGLETPAEVAERVKAMEREKPTDAAGKQISERIEKGESALDAQKAKERKGIDFKRYAENEPKSPEIKGAPKPQRPEKGPNIPATAKALGISIKELKKMIDEAGVPPERPVDPAHIPYVLEKLYGFTPLQAKLIAENPPVVDLIFDGPSLNPRLLKIRGEIADVERDAALSDSERAIKLEKLRIREEKIPEKEREPFTANDIFIDDLGNIKPISSRANEYFNTMFDHLELNIPELDWPIVSWLGKVKPRGKEREAQLRRIVDSFTLNDLVHALRMDETLTKLKYHRDMLENPGISDLPKAERYMWKVAQLFANHKFHNTIFGMDDYIKAQLRDIARKEGVRLDDRQLEVAKTIIKMQNEGRGINATTGEARAIEEARARYNRPADRKVQTESYTETDAEGNVVKKRRVKEVRSISISDVEYYFAQDQAPEWTAAAQVAKDISGIARLPYTDRGKVETLRGIVKERIEELDKFNLRFTNLRERVRWASKLEKYASDRDRINSNEKWNKAKKAAELAKVNKKIQKVIGDHLDPLRRASFQEEYGRLEQRHKEDITRINNSKMSDKNKRIAREESSAKYDEAIARMDKAKREMAAKEEMKWGPLRRAPYMDKEAGITRPGGEVEAIENLGRQLNYAYAALKKMKYDAIPQTWKAGERRVIGQIYAGVGTMPSVGHMQVAAMATAVRNAIKNKGGTKVIAAKEVVVPKGAGATTNMLGLPEGGAEGLEMGTTAEGGTSAWSLFQATGRSPEDILIMKETVKELVAKQRLSPEQKERLRIKAEKMAHDKIKEAAGFEALSKLEQEQLLKEEAAWAEQMTGNQYLSAIEAQKQEQGGWPGWEVDPEEVYARELERGAGTLSVDASDRAGMGITGNRSTAQFTMESKKARPTAEQQVMIDEANRILANDTELMKAMKDYDELLEAEGLQKVYDTLPSGELKRQRMEGYSERKELGSNVSISPTTMVVKEPKTFTIRDKRDLANIKTGAEELSKKLKRPVSGLEFVAYKTKIPIEKLREMNNLPTTAKRPWIGQRIKLTEAVEEVENGNFDILIFQNPMTAKEYQNTELKLKILRSDLKNASKDPVFFSYDEATKKWPWLADSGKVRFHRIGQKVTYYKYKGKNELGIPVEVVESRPAEYPVREYERGFYVSDRTILKHDATVLAAKLAGSRIVETKGKVPVVVNGRLRYDEVGQGPGKPRKLVWKFDWMGPEEDVIKPGDPMLIRMARSAEVLIKDYLRRNAPDPTDRAGVPVEFEFAESKLPTIHERRKSTWRGDDNKALYREKYGRDYDPNAPPPTTRIYHGKDKAGREFTDELTLSRDDRLAERRLWAKIHKKEMLDKAKEAIQIFESPIERALHRVAGLRYEYPEMKSGKGVLGTMAKAETTKERIVSEKAQKYLEEHPKAVRVPHGRGTIRQKVVTGIGAIEQEIRSATDLWPAQEGVETAAQAQARLIKERKKGAGIFATDPDSIMEEQFSILGGSKTGGKETRTHTDKRILAEADKANRVFEGLRKTAKGEVLTTDPEKVVSEFRQNFIEDSAKHDVPNSLWDALVEYHRNKPAIDFTGEQVIPAGEKEVPGLSRPEMQKRFSKQNATLSKMGEIHEYLKEMVENFEADKDALNSSDPVELEGSKILFIKTLSDLRNMMEMINNKRYPSSSGPVGTPSKVAPGGWAEISPTKPRETVVRELGPEGTVLTDAKNWIKGYEEVTKNFETKLEDGLFMVRDGKVLDQLSALSFPLRNIKYLETLYDLPIEPVDYVLTGSVPLAIRGLRDNKDIDVLVSDSTFETLSIDREVLTRDSGAKYIKYNDQIEIYTDQPGITFEDAKARADKVDGFNILNIEDTKVAKRALGREKDLKDVKLLESFQESKKAKPYRDMVDTFKEGAAEVKISELIPEMGEVPGGKREYRKGGVSLTEEASKLPKTTEEAIEMGKGLSMAEARRLQREAEVVDKELASLRGKEDLSVAELQKFQNAAVENQFRHEAIDSFLTRGSDKSLTPEERTRKLGMWNERESVSGPASRIDAFSGVEGVPGGHRFLKKPGPSINERMEAMGITAKQHTATINGKKVILPGASSKEVEKALRQGAKMSKEAKLDPSTRLAQREAEFNIASSNAMERPPVKVPKNDPGKVAKKVITSPTTKDAVLREIKIMEDERGVPFHLTEEERISLYNRNPVKSRNWIRGGFENVGQFSQSSIPEFRLLAQGTDKERMNAIHSRKILVENPDSPIKRMREIAKEVQGAKSWKEGMEKATEFAMYNATKGEIPTDPAIKEILRIAEYELAEPFSKAEHMVELGIDIKGYKFPLVPDMNQTYEKVRARYGGTPYEKLLDIKGGSTIMAMTSKAEWDEINSIFSKREYWNAPAGELPGSGRSLTDLEKDRVRRHVFQFTSALDDYNYLPAEIKARMRLKDTFNKHLQRRSSPDKKDFLSYKHDMSEAWEHYIHNMIHVKYMNNVKELATPLLNAYPDRDVPLSPGWQMEHYLKKAFHGWDPVEKFLAASTNRLNDLVGREVFNPASVAKGLPAAITGQTVKGAIGMVDSTIRQLVDHTKMMVMDESFGKTYMKTWFEVFKNWVTTGKTVGKYWNEWDALALGQEGFERVRELSLKDRLARTDSIPKKLYTLYDWIGTKALGPFQIAENFNKGFGLVFNINRMKAKGADWNESVQLGLHSVIGDKNLQFVPKPIYDAYNQTLNQTIGYSKEHRNLLMGLNPLTRISTIFWSYPGDMARFLYQGTADGWYMGRHHGEWGQFVRFMGYIGFQVSIAQAVGQTLGLDVGSIFGMGMLPVKALSLPWEILYNTFQGVDPTQYVGKPMFQEEQRQKALEGLQNALGIILVPQYRYGKQVINNIKSLEDGFKTTQNGRDIMEWTVPRAILTAVGFPPIENRETYNLLAELDELGTKESAQKRVLLADGVKALAKRDYKELAKIKSKADSKKIPLSYSDIYDAAKDQEELTVLEAGYKRAPKNVKEQYKGKIEELKARAFPGGEMARKIRKQRNMWSSMDNEDNEE